MPTIRQRGSTFEAQVRKRGWEPQVRSFPTERDARQWANEVETEMRRGTFVDRSSLQSLTLANLLQRYSTEASPLKKGGEVERSRLSAMMREPMARLTLDRVSAATVRAWRDARKSVVQGETVRRDMNLLSSVFKKAACEWDIPVLNPVSGVERPAKGKGRKRRPKWSELKRLLRELSPQVYVKDGFRGARNVWVRWAVMFALRTAMRMGEILAIRWKDVNFDARYVLVADSKNGDARNVPLTRRAEAILRRLPRGAPEQKVFPITASALKQTYARARTRANVIDLRFHDFRHEATTRFAKRLPNVLELAQVTGHKSLSSLQTYFHPEPAELASKLD